MTDSVLIPGQVRRSLKPRSALVLLVAAALTAVAVDQAWGQDQTGQFAFERSADPVSGRERSQIRTTELNPAGSEAAQLAWRCDGPELEVFVGTRASLTDRAGVEWRIDGGAPSPYTSWPVVPQGMVRAPEAIVPLLTDRAKAGGTLLVKFWDDRGLPEELEFGLDGLTAALLQLDCAAPSVSEMTAADPSRNVLWMYGSSGNTEATATLKLACVADQPGIEVIQTGPALAEVAGVDFDGQPAVEDYWEPRSLSGPRGALLGRFLRRLAVAKSLGMRFRTVSDGRVLVRFDLSGFREAYPKLECGEDLPTRRTVPDRTVNPTRGPIPVEGAGQGTSEETIYGIGDGVSMPIVLSRSEPEYTDEARAAGIEGTVVLEVVILRDGAVGPVTVVESLDPGLDRNAVAAVGQWRFRPALRDGEAVGVRARIDIRFSLQ